VGQNSSRIVTMAAGFRGNIFDPALIVAQIVAMQSCFYISLGLWVFVADRFGGIETSLAQIFDFHVSYLGTSNLCVSVCL